MFFAKAFSKKARLTENEGFGVNAPGPSPFYARFYWTSCAGTYIGTNNPFGSDLLRCGPKRVP
jgi:hypothetical protein